MRRIAWGALLLPSPAAAHERWILTPEEVLALNSLPKPEVFTDFTPEGLTILIAFVAAITVLLYMHYIAPPRWLTRISGRARLHARWVPVVIRFCAAWALVSSAFALEPRLGSAPMAYPTLFAPDLALADLGPGWAWLRWAELALGLWLLSGAWARLAAVALLQLTILGSVLFGYDMLPYLPIWLAVSYYLLARGSGPLALRLPVPSLVEPLRAPFVAEPLRHSQFVLRVAAGISFMHLAIVFKIMQPNLAVGIIRIYDVPILNLAPETFVFLMAMIEFCGGLLIATGIVIRVVAAFLLGAFLFFAACLPETYTAHMVLYGIMIAFLLAGPGRLSPRGLYATRQTARA